MDKETPIKYNWTNEEDIIEYYKDNKARRERKKRARKNNIIEDFSNKEWLAKLKDTKGFCSGYKRKPHFVGIAHLELDHIYPVDLAHKDYLKTGIKRVYNINSVQPLCKSCNGRKSNNKISINKSLKLTTIKTIGH